MFVSKTISIDMEDLVIIQNLVENSNYGSISAFVQIAIDEKIQKINKNTMNGIIKK